MQQPNKLEKIRSCPKCGGTGIITENVKMEVLNVKIVDTEIKLEILHSNTQRSNSI